jgi:hypothetical protein
MVISINHYRACLARMRHTQLLCAGLAVCRIDVCTHVGVPGNRLVDTLLARGIPWRIFISIHRQRLQECHDLSRPGERSRAPLNALEHVDS